ncbi:unnamed protein product [Sphagnum jensenii]|uniref:Uncharacterized protein n=1 Tax=Sphagnum jensenii TaxID=128206 RepID=A0ABP0W4R2_9BRYO
MRAFALMAGMRPNAVLFKFVTSEDCQVALWGRKGLAETKLGLDEDLTPAQQARKSELWSLFKEAKAMGKHTRLSSLRLNNQVLWLNARLTIRVLVVGVTSS